MRLNHKIKLGLARTAHFKDDGHLKAFLDKNLIAEHTDKIVHVSYETDRTCSEPHGKRQDYLQDGRKVKLSYASPSTAGGHMGVFVSTTKPVKSENYDWQL